MLAIDAGSRTRTRRRTRHRIGLRAEALESRRLLASTPIDVTSGLAFATGLPVAGLATGIGLASPTPTLPTANVGVSPAPVVSSTVSSSTGPATTLSPLMTDSETANAPASEVARPTPGRSDRISNLVEAPEIVPLPHLREPEPVAIIPRPEVRPVPPAPPPAEPAAPARPIDAAPAPDVLKETPAAPKEKEPRAFRAWDAAIDLVATELVDDSPALPTRRAEGAMAVGALLAAWGGWRYGPRLDGRSRRRPLAVAALEAGPGDGAGS